MTSVDEHARTSARVKVSPVTGDSVDKYRNQQRQENNVDDHDACADSALDNTSPAIRVSHLVRAVLACGDRTRRSVHVSAGRRCDGRMTSVDDRSTPRQSQHDQKSHRDIVPQARALRCAAL